MKPHSCLKMADWFHELSESDWISLVDKKNSDCMIKQLLFNIEPGYSKILWFVSVVLINYLSQPLASANNQSGYHWQITIFCSTLLNNNCLLLLALILFYFFRLVWTGILLLFIPKLEKEGYWTVAINVSFKLLFFRESRGLSEQVMVHCRDVDCLFMEISLIYTKIHKSFTPRWFCMTCFEIEVKSISKIKRKNKICMVYIRP